MMHTQEHIVEWACCWLIFAAIMTSCNVTSNEWVDCPAGTEVDPSPFLGNWELVSVAGETPQQTVTLAIHNNGTNVLATYDDGGGASTETARLTRVNGDVIASLKGDADVWSIAKLLLSADSNQLLVADMDRDVVRSDVIAGVVTGEVYEVDEHAFSVNITASSSDIRAYVLQRSGLFYTSGMLFARQP